MTLLLALLACASSFSGRHDASEDSTHDTAWDTAFDGLYCCTWYCDDIGPTVAEVEDPSVCEAMAEQSCGAMEMHTLQKRECSTYGT